LTTHCFVLMIHFSSTCCFWCWASPCASGFFGAPSFSTKKITARSKHQKMTEKDATLAKLDDDLAAIFSSVKKEKLNDGKKEYRQSLRIMSDQLSQIVSSNTSSTSTTVPFKKVFPKG
jgi:hypothetical protein